MWIPPGFQNCGLSGADAGNHMAEARAHRPGTGNFVGLVLPRISPLQDAIDGVEGGNVLLPQSNDQRAEAIKMFREEHGDIAGADGLCDLVWVCDFDRQVLGQRSNVMRDFQGGADIEDPTGLHWLQLSFIATRLCECHAFLAHERDDRMSRPKPTAVAALPLSDGDGLAAVARADRGQYCIIDGVGYDLDTAVAEDE